MPHSCPIDRPCPKKTWAIQIVAVLSAGAAAGMAWTLSGGEMDTSELFRLCVLLILAGTAVGAAVWRVLHTRRVGRSAGSELAGPAVTAVVAAGLLAWALVLAIAG